MGGICHMDRHIRRKTKRNEDKYILDYRKCKDDDQGRYSIVETMNKRDTVFILINSSLALVDHHENQKKPFESREEQREVITYLEMSGFRVAWITPKYEEKAMLFGVPMGKAELKTRFILGVCIEQGRMNKELYERVLSGCDYMMGIGCLTDYDMVYDAIDKGDYTKIDDAPFFKYTCIDSPFMKQCYTDYPWEWMDH